MDPFLGEIRIFPWSWAPSGWALCNGASLPVQQNAALNALLGQTFGGNGTTTFNLPNLQGRTPIHAGIGSDGIAYNYGNSGGVEGVTLTATNFPPHQHSVNALSQTAGNAGNASSSLPAKVGIAAGGSTVNIYSIPGPIVQLSTDTMSIGGASAAHNNMQPFIVTNFCIATLGIFPPRQ